MASHHVLCALGVPIAYRLEQVAMLLNRVSEADDTVEPQEGVVVRTRKGRLVGITIIGLRNYLS